MRPIWRAGSSRNCACPCLDLSTALLGGLCMGYGARIAYGCNIGAYLGGMISGSLHGLVWMMAALVGSALALKLRTGRGYM